MHDKLRERIKAWMRLFVRGDFAVAPVHGTELACMLLRDCLAALSAPVHAEDGSRWVRYEDIERTVQSLVAAPPAAAELCENCGWHRFTPASPPPAACQHNRASDGTPAGPTCDRPAVLCEEHGGHDGCAEASPPAEDTARLDWLATQFGLAVVDDGPIMEAWFPVEEEKWVEFDLRAAIDAARVEGK